MERATEKAARSNARTLLKWSRLLGALEYSQN